MYCPNCGALLRGDETICPNCGAPLASDFGQPGSGPNGYYGGNSNYPYKSRLVALLLCIFLGELGVHRFYVGKFGTGLLWLCTGGLLGVGWILDIIGIAMGTFRDKYFMPLI